MRNVFFIIVSLASISYANPSFGLPAFPGAEGMGASASGARGYSGSTEVCLVTNTNDTGPGSFRNCVDGTGHDGTYVVFRTSGIINLESDVHILSSNMTIAGETSPSGIVLEGGQVNLGDASAGVHDIIVRHMRFRPGSRNYNEGSRSEHALLIWRSSHIIIDHCSFSWGSDEVVSATTYVSSSLKSPFDRITFSWCIFSEGLADPAPESNHAYAFLANASGNTQSTLTIHHSYFAHHNGRMPRIDGNILVDFRNNIVYNWHKMFNSSYMTSNTEMTANHVGNYVKPGPNSDACYPTYRSGEGQLRNDSYANYCPDSGQNPYPALYMSGNFGCIRDEPADDEWAVVCGNTGSLASTSWKAISEFPTVDLAVTTSAMSYSYAQEVLNNVGATKPVRDSVDTRVINDFMEGDGSILGDKNYSTNPEDWGTFGSAYPPTDNDSDGMDDSWETARGLNTAVDDHAGDDDSDGYTNIEEYLHYLIGIPEAPKNLRIVWP